MGLNIYTVCRLQGEDLTGAGQEEEGEEGQETPGERKPWQKMEGGEAAQLRVSGAPRRRGNPCSGPGECARAWAACPFLPREILVYPARLEENVIKLWLIILNHCQSSRKNLGTYWSLTCISLLEGWLLFSFVDLPQESDLNIYKV